MNSLAGMVNSIALGVVWLLLLAGCSGQAVDSLTGSSRDPVTLMVAFKGDGVGSVASEPAGISCPEESCELRMPRGSRVTLTGIAAEGSYLGGWIGECTPIPGGTCELELSEDVTITAVFVYDDPDRTYPDGE